MQSGILMNNCNPVNSFMVSPSILKTTPRLLNRYSIQQNLGARLGRRTMLGYDHIRHSWVIIKYLCFDDPLQANDIKRFHQEVTVLKNLKHQAIPAYYDSFEIEDHGYHGCMLVQEYIEGKSLYTLINTQRVFTEEEIRKLAQQILAILDYLHTKKSPIIHRDIKPSSFVLNTLANSTPGDLYLVDFGLVQCASTTQTDTETDTDTPILISGTPGYRPPEQLGDRAMPATDLYSLGATLIHLATGKHPNTLPQSGLRLLFSQELEHMSRPLKSWLRWLTQPKQHKRPISAKSALKGLEQADEIFSSSHWLSFNSLSHRLQRTFLETMAPANTQLKILEYSQMLEVLFPPLGWKSRKFCLAMLQTIVSAASVWLTFRGFLYFWPQLVNVWQQLSIIIIGLGWTYFNVRSGYRGLQSICSSLFQQISIQLLPEIILLGHRFPCRPVDYKINTYKRDIEDIHFQKDSSLIKFFLHNNRTIVGKLKYTLSAKELELTQSEISWVNDILQLWLKQPSSTGLA
ncbi:serine/threonine protein kinase [Leptolyngbyaceae cyanobacterium CCMR0081]|uniref:Serine/threonine protein kinase n=2 Tax=Adonisia TaxID=2950183 RepID=A0A6M0RUX3_9CYAN|nr:serine/threonine protein kinase [Adonisia turfae CCMR0081]